MPPDPIIPPPALVKSRAIPRSSPVDALQIPDARKIPTRTHPELGKRKPYGPRVTTGYGGSKSETETAA